MADLEFYKLSMTGAEADGGIRTGMEAGATSGVLLGDGNGGVSAATPGQDFGYPLIKGNGPPTGNTAANIGQHYFDMQATAAPYEYICVGLNANGFIWLVFGDAGNGFIISGYFASIDALNAAIAEGIVPAPTPGVNYAIGTEPPYDTVTWDGVANDWKNNGPLGASGGGSGVPPHGTTGQVLTKLSDLDGDAGWKDIALKGEGAPTASTVGMIGQLYIDTTAMENPAYICVGISTADNVTTYVWQPVGGEIEASDITDALGYNPGMVNPNLIDNWYFVGGGSQQGGSQLPINQRGQTSYSGNAYSVDRWFLGNYVQTWTLSSDGFEITSNTGIWLEQRLKNSLSSLIGKTITISAIIDDNLITATSVVDGAKTIQALYSKNGTNIYVACKISNTDKFFRVVNYSIVDTATIKVKAVKLELGSRQTLAHQENGVWVLNEIPDYGEQLARCQRVQIQLNVNMLAIGRTAISADTSIIAFIPLPVTMRVNPVLELAGATASNYRVYANGRSYTPNSISVTGVCENGVILSLTVPTGIGVMQSCVVAYGTTEIGLISANF